MDESVAGPDEADASLTLLHVNKVLEDHIVLGLCALTDGIGSSFGDAGFIRSMQAKKGGGDRRVSAQAALSDLESHSRQLRERRDARIASFEQSTSTTERISMIAALRAAAELVDALDGHRCTYHFLGKDLREVVLGEESL